MIEAAEIMERGEAIRRLADSLAGKPVVWGPDGDDCCQLPLQWVVSWRERMTGICPDVEAPAYDNREEAHAIIDAAGGLAKVWEPICGQLGLEPLGPADIPIVGDVGIMRMSTTEVGGIFLHGGLLLWRCDAERPEHRGFRTIDVVGRTFLRNDSLRGWQKFPVLVKAWQL